MDGALLGTVRIGLVLVEQRSILVNPLDQTDLLTNELKHSVTTFPPMRALPKRFLVAMANQPPAEDKNIVAAG